MMTVLRRIEIEASRAQPAFLWCRWSMTPDSGIMFWLVKLLNMDLNHAAAIPEDLKPLFPNLKPRVNSLWNVLMRGLGDLGE